MPDPDPRFPTRRDHRLPGYDYRSPGAYFITICAYKAARCFGMVWNGVARLNDLGEIAAECWREIAQVQPAVAVDEFVIMPTHLHGILLLDPPGFRRTELDAPTSSSSGPMAGSIGAIVGQFKRAVTLRARETGVWGVTPIWQRNYHDKIIRDPAMLDRARRYIRDNPIRWHG